MTAAGVTGAGGEQQHSGRQAVVFDLDGTLLDGDSTAHWMAERLVRAPLRLGAALLIAPVALPLSMNAHTRRWGASAFLWVASFGADEQGLVRSFEVFAARVASGGARVRWRPGGLAVLEGHIAGGDRVAVATAAPAWLARALLEAIGCAPTVVGSGLCRRLGGWIGETHCRSDAKCEALLAAGFGERWSAAYTDSADDFPLLMGAERPFLVSGSKRVRARLARRGIEAERAVW